MSPAERTYAIEKLFAPIGDMEEPSEERGRLIVAKWSKELHALADSIHVWGTVRVKTHTAIDEWMKQTNHGGPHSYYVYEGMKWIANQEGTPPDTKSDALYQALAVLHDLGQLVPFVDPASGKPLSGDQRKLHPMIMAASARYFGKSFGLNSSQLQDIVTCIRHHDDEYFGKRYDNFPNAGKLLADADKLFGAGLSRNSDVLAAGAIRRSLAGSSPPEGWYFFRDLSPKERNNWMYGDRWLSDNVSAVRTEAFTIGFYTQTGRAVAEKKRHEFLNQAKIVYEELYDRTQNLVAQLERNRAEISLVGKNQNGKGSLTEAVSGSMPIYDIILYAYNKPLPVRTRPGAENPRGWFIKGIVDENTIFVDPSIARFPTKQKFLAQLMQAFAS